MNDVQRPSASTVVDPLGDITLPRPSGAGARTMALAGFDMTAQVSWIDTWPTSLTL